MTTIGLVLTNNRFALLLSVATKRIKKKVNNKIKEKVKWQEQILNSCCRLAATLAT